MKTLTGKVAIVTGGGSGIGLGIARRLSEEGAVVVVAQRHRSKELKALERVYEQCTDLVFAEEIQKLVSDAVARHGGVDILVNNAGIMIEKTLEEMSEAEWDRTLDVNLKAPFLLAKEIVPIMRARGGGSIINIGSIEGSAANPRHAAYCASKAGLQGLTAAIAVDHGHDGVRCNAIAPGWIMSALSEKYIESFPDKHRVRRELTAMHPVGRLGEPADIANLALWLASDQSTFVTGQVFVVDGGRTKKLPLPSTS